MSFSATVFNILVASPSDVPSERIAICDAIHEWNYLNSRETQKVLLPVRWETHSVPAMGDRPQALLNDQLVKSCDMLIGAFWTRLGTHTGKEESGTVEEVKWFLDQKKPVMLYYSSADVPQNSIDLDQMKRLKEFKASIRDRGIQEQYASVENLKEKVIRHLTVVARGMSTGPVIDKKVLREARESTKPVAPTEVVTEVSTARQVQNDEIYFEDYTEKAFIVRGDTTAFRKKLLDANGRWIPTKTGPKGWMFSKRHLKEVAKILDIEPTLLRAETTVTVSDS